MWARGAAAWRIRARAVVDRGEAAERSCRVSTEEKKAVENTCCERWPAMA